MGFKKMEPARFPPRLWSLVGYPRSGKSTFAARMHGPMVVIDADHRFQEVLHLSEQSVYELSERPSDNADPRRIAALLHENMPGSDVRTIVVDSLTAIITPLVVQAMVDHEAGEERNLSAAFRKKALAMRQIQDAITRWGADVLWIYHLQDARDSRANQITRATISQTELARLTRSINVQLEAIYDEESDRRGIRVVCARRGRSGMVLWDETGSWEGMPERIEEAIYAGLSLEERDQIERRAPELFPNPETAVAWSMEQQAYRDELSARRAYDALKEEERPKTARDMASIWVEHVRSKLIEAGHTAA